MSPAYLHAGKAPGAPYILHCRARTQGYKHVAYSTAAAPTATANAACSISLAEILVSVLLGVGVRDSWDPGKI